MIDYILQARQNNVELGEKKTSVYSPWLLQLLFLSYSSAFCFDLFLTAQTLNFFIFPDRKTHCS